jgi:uncharacterized protein
MIVSFSLANFRSFSSEETFNLVASGRLGQNHEDHVVSIPDSDQKVLRAAVLYGANGAGKSNLFKALKYVRAVALRPRKKASGTGRESFRFGHCAEEASSFDLQFISNSKLYRFGFKVDDARIKEEWLALVEGPKERILYERVTDDNGKVTIDAQGIKAGGEKLRRLRQLADPKTNRFLPQSMSP